MRRFLDLAGVLCALGLVLVLSVPRFRRIIEMRRWKEARAVAQYFYETDKRYCADQGLCAPSNVLATKLSSMEYFYTTGEHAPYGGGLCDCGDLALALKTYQFTRNKNGALEETLKKTVIFGLNIKTFELCVAGGTLPWWLRENLRLKPCFSKD